MLETKLKVKDSEAEIEGEIPWEVVDRHLLEVLEEWRQEFTAPGFRKGHVPMEIFRQQVREDHALEDAAERALQEAYPPLIEEHKLDTLGRPEVTITKLAAGNPMGFRVRVGVVPEIKLPNYKKIAQEIMAAESTPEVATEEIEKIIDDLRRLRAGKSVDTPATNEGEEASESLPELTDEFVKTLGDFQNVNDFRAKLADNLKLEKEAEMSRERREKLAQALGEKAKMTLPASVLDAETAALEEKLEADLKQAKISMEDYLAKLKKTREALLAEHRAWAERQLRTRFILEAIAKEENITADPEELAAEVHYLRQQHPQADPESLRRYAEIMLRNEKILRFLEGKEDTKAAPEPTSAPQEK